MVEEPGPTFKLAQFLARVLCLLLLVVVCMCSLGPEILEEYDI